MSQMKVCVVGMGYIGLPTACIFADAGFDVLGVDINSSVIDSIASGQSHIKDEPDLEEALARVVRSGKLKASLKPEVADLFIICVPTPFKGDHKADLTYVESAMAGILNYVRPGCSVVLESTSPPGTTEMVIASALRAKGFVVGRDVFVAYCPERVLPGQILRELKQNARTVGGVTALCAQKVSSFYSEIIDGPVTETTATVAETVKLVENSFRDVNIAFANEVSMMCAHLGIDHKEVIRFANQHPRVKILTPGPGVGGHCIAVDPWFLVEAAPKQTNLIRTAREVNLEKTHYVVESIKSKLAERFKSTNQFQRVCLFGMSYKANVADFRESPSVEIAHALSKELGNMAEVQIVDPYLECKAFEGIDCIPLDQAKSTVSGVLNVKLVAHKQFDTMKFEMDFSC